MQSKFCNEWQARFSLAAGTMQLFEAIQLRKLFKFMWHRVGTLKCVEQAGVKYIYYAAMRRLLINNSEGLKRGGAGGTVIDVSRSERSEGGGERARERNHLHCNLHLSPVCLPFSLSLSAARSLVPAHTSTQRILVTLAHVH